MVLIGDEVVRLPWTAAEKAKSMFVAAIWSGERLQWRVRRDAKVGSPNPASCGHSKVTAGDEECASNDRACDN
jgi:hypothetical protein